MQILYFVWQTQTWYMLVQLVSLLILMIVWIRAVFKCFVRDQFKSAPNTIFTVYIDKHVSLWCSLTICLLLSVVNHESVSVVFSSLSVPCECCLHVICVWRDHCLWWVCVCWRWTVVVRVNTVSAAATQTRSVACVRMVTWCCPRSLTMNTTLTALNMFLCYSMHCGRRCLA